MQIGLVTWNNGEGNYLKLAQGNIKLLVTLSMLTSITILELSVTGAYEQTMSESKNSKSISKSIYAKWTREQPFVNHGLLLARL